MENFQNYQEVSFSFGTDFIKSVSDNSDYTIRTAIDELIDNALAANATEINCSIYADEYGKTVFKITDNGDGMSPDDFKNKFLVFGDSSNKNSEKASSFFGIGGKTGTIFLSKAGGDIEIVTHKNGYPTCMVLWGKGSSPKLRVEDNNQPFGTTIIIKDCILDVDNDAGKLINYIGVDYYPTLSKRNDVVIRMNGNKVKPIDPLYRNVLSEEHYKYAQVKIDGIECPITFVTFNDNKLKKEQIHEYDKMFCKKTSNALTTTATSGLYFVYGGRYIAFGGNIRLLGLENHTTYNGNRAEIILTKEMASLLKVKWNKSGLSLTLDKNNNTKDLLTVLKDLFKQNVKSKTEKNKDTEKKKDSQQFNNMKKILKDCSGDGYLFNLNVNEDSHPDLPVLTYEVEYGNSKSNKKRKGLFSINTKSRKYPNNARGVNSFIKQLSIELPALTYIATKLTEDEMSMVIQKRYQ